jgi:formylglycine-generating enzyme required for sulfatase activity
VRFFSGKLKLANGCQATPESVIMQVCFLPAARLGVTMSDLQKKQRLTSQLRQTFALLGKLFAETPPEQPRLSARRTVAQLHGVLQAYAEKLISACGPLPLPGLGFENQTVETTLEQAYFPLTVLDQRAGKISPENDDGFFGGAGALTIANVLQRYRQLVLIGEPGSGKTTLLEYLALTYARSWLGTLALEKGASLIKERFFLDEAGSLPLLVRLPKLVSQLQIESATREPLPLELFLNSCCAEFLGPETSISADFLKTYLAAGQAVFLLDGLDEIPAPAARQRVVRWIAALSASLPACRYLVTSRQLEADELARLGSGFGLAKICALDPTAVRQFLSAWNLTLATTLAGKETPEIIESARQEVAGWLETLEADPRLGELAATPFNLILLAELFRQTAQLPVSRLGLHAQALEVLIRPPAILTGLKVIALWLYEHQKSEIRLEVLRQLLAPEMLELVTAPPALQNQFGGLLRQRSVDSYGFRQRTWQSYLAACALVERADGLAAALKHLSDPSWREVLVWLAGLWLAPGPFQNLESAAELWAAEAKIGSNSALLAAECLQNVDEAFWPGELVSQFRKSFKKQARALLKPRDRSTLLQKLAVNQAQTQLEGEAGAEAPFWKLPHGEPVWVTIPAGEFWMGEVDQLRRVFLAEYHLARVPVTNAQYALYLAASGAQPPESWRAGQIPRGRGLFPVTNVSWYEAQAYCTWLGEQISQPVGLPSEAEWEKAARGAQDQRPYPWGETWADFCANTSELGLGETTPVGFFPAGASPFGVLDLVGNVREWTRSLYLQPDSADREDLDADSFSTAEAELRVLRGGSYYFSRLTARCAYRQRYYPDFKFHNFGFRVVISPHLV